MKALTRLYSLLHNGPAHENFTGSISLLLSKFMGSILHRSGLLKKAHNIFVLYDAEVALIIFSTKGKLYEYSTDSCWYEDYLAAPFPLGLYKHFFLPSKMIILPVSLGASTCISISDILHDEKVIDQSPGLYLVWPGLWLCWIKAQSTKKL